MKIGLDIDGTISECPELFSILAKGVMVDGGEVHVISFRNEDYRPQTVEQLEQWEIWYSHLHLAPPEVHDPGPWKAGLIREYHIEAMFEDSPEVLSHLPINVHRIWLCNPAIFDMRRVVDTLRTPPFV